MPRRPRHRRTTLRRRAVRTLSACAALLAVGAGVTGAVLYDRLDSNIAALDTTDALGEDRPSPVAHPARPHSPTTHRPLNVLLIGSDDRTGTRIGGNTPGLSDTTVLVHVNAARTAITGVSIPRDSMVNRPDCLDPKTGATVPGELAMFNTAYAVGGPGCAQRTVEQLTGVRTDHFAVVNLAGFPAMVDALGGVPICVPHEVNDHVGKIYLPAGSYTATGQQALGYVRERHTLSANGDLGRMKRQQAFLSAMAAKTLSTGTLTNPRRLYAFLDAATGALTTDPALASPAALATLAAEMGGISPHAIRFLSVPTVAYPADPNRLVWTPEADQIWHAFRTDTALPSSLRRESVETAASKRPKTARGGDRKTRASDDNGLCA